MKIDTNSWHYRQFDWWRKNTSSFLLKKRQVTLCNYFWTVILRTPFLRVWIRILNFAQKHPLLMIWLVVTLFSMIFVIPISLETRLAGIIIFAVVQVFVAIIIILSLSSIKINPSKETVQKLSLVASYVAAKKSKVCPILEFEGEESNEQASYNSF